MFGFSGIFKAIEAVLKFVRVWGKLAVVVGPALAAVWYSPWFKQFFLGIAVGAGLLFSLQYTEIFAPPETKYCISPTVDPNGPKCMKWNSTDDQRGYGYWSVCEGLS